jgi:hypothetical protein
VLAGHVAVGLLGRTRVRDVSAGTLVLAAVAADLLAFAFVLAGLERIEFLDGRGAARYFHPIEIGFSHSLAANAVWGGVFASILIAAGRARASALVAGVLVVSHWVLDVVSHPPDMPVAPGLTSHWGFGLWTSIPATVVVEGGLWLVALLLFARRCPPVSRGRRVGFWLGAALITLIWVGNIAGPPPANPATAPIASLALFGAIVGWAYWVDRRGAKSHRRTVALKPA